MYYIKEQNYTIIPMDFNCFYDISIDYKNKIKYSDNYYITEVVMNKMCQFIENCNENNIVIDMQGIFNYPTRAFTKLQNSVSKLTFINVHSAVLKDMIEEDLDEIEWIPDENAFLYKDGIGIPNQNLYMIARQNEVARILTDIVIQNNKNGYYLESSGLFSNYYLDIKKLFLNVKEYYFIVFSMAKKMRLYLINNRIDALVSASKNGALVANILGLLLDIKEVHLIGIGPKFSMELGNSIECIKKGKRYAYVYDFMCTGTELKLASALINSKKAYLDYAIGIAKYSRDKEVLSVKINDVLLTTDDLEIDYRITGKKDYLQ